MPVEWRERHFCSEGRGAHGAEAGMLWGRGWGPVKGKRYTCVGI